jgi:hypothetical protein
MFDRLVRSAQPITVPPSQILRAFRIGFDPLPRSEQRASGHREMLDDGSERKRG